MWNEIPRMSTQYVLSSPADQTLVRLCETEQSYEVTLETEPEAINNMMVTGLK